MKNILIVDDSAFARRTLRQILEEGGFNVVEAKDGHDAIEQYYLRRPDLVLLDMVMEGMDRLEVLRKIRELDADAEIVIATADIQHATEAEARQTGAVGYLRKPFTPPEVLQMVSKVLAGEVR
jgi:two-component system, chemotaxis family, chemotaxis protein CheY